MDVSARRTQRACPPLSGRGGERMEGPCERSRRAGKRPLVVRHDARFLWSRARTDRTTIGEAFGLVLRAILVVDIARQPQLQEAHTGNPESPAVRSDRRGEGP